MNRAFAIVFVGLVAAVGAQSRGQDAVEAILDRVEARGDRIVDIRCDVAYRVRDLIAGDERKSIGDILFRKRTPNPAFLITFERTVYDGQVNEKKSWYLFDGRYFFEASQRSKSIIQRDVAPPGTQIDLFSLDKAPFPVPFGQKKSEILKHFEVTLVEPVEGDPANTDHLVCIPKPDSKLADDYSKLEFFVSRTLDLPVRIVLTTDPADKVIEADFPDLSDDSFNRRIPDSVFELPLETREYAKSIE